MDLKARRVAASIDLGRPLRPHSAVFGPDGLLYVTAELANAVEVVDAHKGAVAWEIPTSKPQSHMLALSPDGRGGYTSNVDSGTVSVLDIPSRKLLTIIPVAKRVQRIAVSNDGRGIYVRLGCPTCRRNRCRNQHCKPLDRSGWDSHGNQAHS